MICRIALVLMLAVAASAQEASVAISDPVDVVTPASVAADWWNTPRMPVLDDRGSGAHIENVAAGSWRVDRFERRNGRWSWIDVSRYAGTKSRLPADTRAEPAAILVRDPLFRHRYGWAEYRHDQTAPVVVTWFINITLEGGSAEAFLWAAGLSEPVRTVTLGKRTVFRAVPDGAAYACDESRGLARCAVADPANGVVSLGRAARMQAAGFIVEETADVKVLRPGVSIVHPVSIPATRLQAGRWNVVLVAPEASAGAVFDWLAEAGGMTRVRPTAPIPVHAPVIFPVAPGLSVRTSVGSAKAPVSDPEARLVFAEAEGDARVPLAVIAPSDDGLFVAPHLSAGRFRLKLLSATASSDFVSAMIEGSGIAAVHFASGPSVVGRLVLTSAGTTSDAAKVQVAYRAALSETDLVKDSDPVDLIRQVTASEDGAFEIALPMPGLYVLRAQWGNARAEREFTSTATAESVDLGSIPLSAAASLSGTIVGCGDGELRLTPLPQPGASASFFEFRRIAIASDNSFVADGLPGGTWIVAAKCHGRLVAVVPELIDLPPDAPRYVDLKLATP